MGEDRPSRLVKGVNQITRYEYNGLNQITLITDADNHSTYTEYDEANNIRSFTSDRSVRKRAQNNINENSEHHSPASSKAE